VRSDELIDDVARQMTAVGARPALRGRVMAGIGDASQHTPRRRLMPVAAGAAAAAVALAWLLMPSPPVIDAPPEMAGQTPVAVTEPDPAQSAEVQITRATPAPPRHAAAAPVPWDTAPTAEGSGLPPLAGPLPIVIEPISWSEVTIAPLNVEPIEVKALVVEPLASADRSGV
jgi:hypothetical protein